MAKWGNSLGGWRKQKRARNGQFGNGASKARKRLATNRAVVVREQSGRGSAKTKETRRRKAYRDKSYSRPGGIYRQRRDSALGQGAWSNNSSGGRRGTIRHSGRVATNVAVSAKFAPVAVPILAVSYARHRKYTSSKRNQNEYTLSTGPKSLTAAQRKSRNKKLAVVGAVAATSVIAYGAYQVHQDRKFDTQPGVTLYHNTNRNIMKNGFSVDSRINDAYGKDFVFFSNTPNGLARSFGRKQHKIKYTGDVSNIFRDHAEDSHRLGGVGLLDPRGEQFFMIPKSDLQGNYKIKKTSKLGRNPKDRFKADRLSKANQERSKERYGAEALLGLQSSQLTQGAKASMRSVGDGNAARGYLRMRRAEKGQTFKTWAPMAKNAAKTMAGRRVR